MKIENLPVLEMDKFFFFGSLVFFGQAILSIVMFSLSASLQTLWSTLYSWLSISFNLVLAYFFLTQALSLRKNTIQDASIVLTSEEIDAFLKEK